MPHPLTPAQRADAASARATKDVVRVRFKRLSAGNDERLNTSGHELAGFMKMHESRKVDESGAPELKAALLRRLNGDTSEGSKLRAALKILHRDHKRLYCVVNALLSPVEQGEKKPTERVLASQLGMSKTTVHRSIHALRNWLVLEGFGNST